MEKFPENIEVTRILLTGNSKFGQIINSIYNPAIATNTQQGNSTQVPQNTQSSFGQPVSGGGVPKNGTGTVTNTSTGATIAVVPIFSNIKFQLPRSFIDVIHVDWIFVSGLASSCFCSITELEQNGITLDGIPYWKYLHTSGTIRNPSSDILPVKRGFPRTFNTLNVSLMDSSGYLINQTDPNWSIELIVFSMPQ